MKLTEKNVKALASILAGCAGVFLFIYYLVKYIMSIVNGVYDDGWGTDVSTDMDALIYCLVGLAITVVLGYATKSYLNDCDPTKALLTLVVVVCVVLALYDLGVFFKAMAKGKEYSGYETYLVEGIVYLFAFLSSGLIYSKKYLVK